MSILIKNMEIPKSKGEYALRMYVYSDGTAIIEGAYCRFEGEPFVAITVPPHGDLIDRDEMFEEFVIEGQKSTRYKIGERWELNGEEIRRVIANAPTVIPAEEGE